MDQDLAEPAPEQRWQGLETQPLFPKPEQDRLLRRSAPLTAAS